MVPLQRVVFENGHCLLPLQNNESDYFSMLDQDVQRISGNVLTVHDTGLEIPLASSSVLGEQQGMTLCLENMCGSIRGTFENVPSAGSVMTLQAPRVGRLIKHRRFVGTHKLFHTIHGRIMYRMDKQRWSFKGTRSLEDLITIVRNLSEDQESSIYPVVAMLSVTLRTDIQLVIDPAKSLLQRVLAELFSNVVLMQTRMDDTNNLYFMDVINWQELLRVVEKDRGSTSASGETTDDVDVRLVRSYLALNGSGRYTAPTASIGFTRSGVFFLRITFPKGCVCAVDGSEGVTRDQVVTAAAWADADKVFVGGVEPFVNVLVRFILLILVKLRVVGGGKV
jgi:hypothetical protein